MAKERFAVALLDERRRAVSGVLELRAQDEDWDEEDWEEEDEDLDDDDGEVPMGLAGQAENRLGPRWKVIRRHVMTRESRPRKEPESPRRGRVQRKA